MLLQEAHLAKIPPLASVRRGPRPYSARVKFRVDGTKYEGVSLPDLADGLMYTPRRLWST